MKMALILFGLLWMQLGSVEKLTAQVYDELTAETLVASTETMERLAKQAMDSMQSNRAFSISRLYLIQKMAVMTQNKSFELKSNYHLANIFFENRRFNSSVEFLKKGFELIEKEEVKAESRIRFNLYRMAVIALAERVNDIDVSYYEQKLTEIIETETDSILIRQFKLSLASTFQTIRKPDLAIKLIEELLAVKSANIDELLSLYILLSSCYSAKNDSQKALSILYEAKRQVPSDDTFNLILIEGNIATLYETESRYLEAIAILEKLFEESKTNKNRALYIANAVFLARNYQFIKKDESTFYYANLAVEEIEKTGIRHHYYQALYLLESAFVRKGDFEKAYDTRVKKDALFTENKSREMASELSVIKAESDIFKNSLEVQLLKSEQDRAQQINYLLILIAVLLAGFSGLIWRWNQRIRQLNVALSHQNEQIETQKRNLETLVETKDRMFSILGHDLRSPISNMFMFLDVLLKNEEVAYASKEEIKARLFQTADSTMELLDNLLYWGREQVGELKPELDLVSIKAVIEEAIQQCALQATSKQIQLSEQLQPYISINTDSRMVSLIVRNLLMNAIKFTPDGGKIEIILKKEGKQVMISIADSGIGMSNEQIQLFLAGESFTTTGTNKEKGFGLGLHLIRSFSNMLGIQLSVNSVQGKGTTFTLLFLEV